MENYSKKFLWRQRIGFGIGDYAFNLSYLMANTYLLIFYTDTAGISAAAAGIMLLATKFIDAFANYTIGALCDRTHTKIGSHRPWMLFGVPMLSISMVLVFTTPNWSPTGKLVWAYVTYIIFSISYAIVNLPYGAMLPKLSSDAKERTKIATARTIFADLGTLTSASFALWLIAKLGHGNSAIGYRNTTIVFSIIVFVIVIISGSVVREINPVGKTKEKTSVVRDFGYLIKNKPFMLLLAYTFFNFLGILGLYASIAYYFKYIVGNQMLTSVAMVIITAIAILGMLLGAYLNNKLTKRNICFLGCIIQILGFIIIYLAGVNVGLIYFGLSVMGIGYGMGQNIYYSMRADVIDYGEWKDGRNLAGTQAAACGFANQLSSACASSIVAAFLAWGAYNGKAAVQTASAKTAIILAFLLIPIGANIIKCITLYFYDLDKNYAQIKEELTERHRKQKMKEIQEGL